MSQRGDKKNTSVPMIEPAKLEIWFAKNEKKLVALIVLLCVSRLYLFCQAFPFFNNVDEQYHFDLVVKYSAGYVPRPNKDCFLPESARLIALYGSPEYFLPPGSSTPEPKWTLPPQTADLVASQITDVFLRIKNDDDFSPPVYYFTAGLWYNIGKWFGYEGGNLLYWLRCMNIGVYVLVLLFAYLYCMDIGKDNTGLRFGVLLLLAFFPQDVFYSINSDVLSPLFVVMSLYFLNQIYISDRHAGYYLAAGLTAALAYLTKLSNQPILFILLLYLILMVKSSSRHGQIKAYMPRFCMLIASVLVPILLWHGWNLCVLSDLMATSEKIQALGWTVKPLSEALNHPLFTLKGMIYFVSELLKTFWRGEFIWQQQRLASHSMDIVYVISSLLFLAAASIKCCGQKQNDDMRSVTKLSLLITMLFVAFLLFISMHYDFGDCFYPSRKLPFLTSGRLMCGALVPFLILYYQGLSWILTSARLRLSPLLIVLVFVILITMSEIAISYPVLKSHFNWFHMVS